MLQNPLAFLVEEYLGVPSYNDLFINNSVQLKDANGVVTTYQFIPFVNGVIGESGGGENTFTKSLNTTKNNLIQYRDSFLIENTITLDQFKSDYWVIWRKFPEFAKFLKDAAPLNGVNTSPYLYISKDQSKISYDILLKYQNNKYVLMDEEERKTYIANNMINSLTFRMCIARRDLKRVV